MYETKYVLLHHSRTYTNVYFDIESTYILKQKSLATQNFVGILFIIKIPVLIIMD